MRAFLQRLQKKIEKMKFAYNQLSFFHFCYIMFGMAKNHLIYRMYRRKEYLSLLQPIQGVSNSSVTIIIPFCDTVSILRKCVESVLEKTDHKDYSIFLVNNRSSLSETKEYLDSLEKDSRIKIFNYNEPFNYSALHNWVIDFVQTEYVLFLNNDTEVINPSWLDSLLVWIEKEDVGAVGTLLLYPDNRIQHAGVGLSYAGPFHLHMGEIFNQDHKLGFNCVHEVFAVTGACLMTKKSLFKKVGGFDSLNLSIGYNDIDYCLMLKKFGYKIVYNPEARLYHYESYTRGYDVANLKKFGRLKKEKDFLFKKWNRFKT